MWLITTRSQVRVLPPQPRKVPVLVTGIFLGVFLASCYTERMILWAVLFGILSMTGYAFANVFSQPLARKFGIAQTILLRGVTVIVALAIVSIPSFHYLSNVQYVLYALILGIAGYLPLLAFTHGIKISRVGIISPIAGSSPFVTVWLAFLILHTSLSKAQWFAILLIVMANIWASINPKSLKDSNIINLASGIPYALLAAIGWGLFYFAFIYPAHTLGPWLSAFIVELGVIIGAGIHLLVSKEAIRFKHALTPGMVGNGLGIVLGTIAFTVGVTKYNVGIVAALSNSWALLSLLLAAYFFKERLNRSEVVAAVLMVAGVMTVSIA